MTHSILLTLKLKDYEDVKQIRQRILEDDEDSWMAMFGLRKVSKEDYYPDIMTKAGLPPFFVFPEKDEKDNEDNLYHIIVESGSHCSFDDIQESFFMWVAWFYFIQEVDSYGIEFTYSIGTDEGEEKLDLKRALSKIIKGSDLSKYIKISEGLK